MNICIQPEI